jgi:hypothetical protein
MRYFLICLIFLVSACKKEVTLLRPSIGSDQIHLDYAKKITEFQKEYEDIQKGIQIAKDRINDSSFTPKVAELIKSEIFIQEKYLRIIQQEIDFLKIKDNERAKYYVENSEVLTSEIIKKDYEDYLVREKANPKKYIWRLRPGLVLPERTKKAEPKKKEPTQH